MAVIIDDKVKAAVEAVLKRGNDAIKLYIVLHPIGGEEEQLELIHGHEKVCVLVLFF